MPYAACVEIFTSDGWKSVHKIDTQGFFEWQGSESIQAPCKIRIDENNTVIDTYDVYSFLPMITSDE